MGEPYLSVSLNMPRRPVWCDRSVASNLYDPKVAPLLKRCVFLQIDTDKHPKLAKSLGVAGLPDIRFLAPDGTPKKILTDFQEAESLTRS